MPANTRPIKINIIRLVRSVLAHILALRCGDRNAHNRVALAGTRRHTKFDDD
jgi:hypothetical protein